MPAASRAVPFIALAVWQKRQPSVVATETATRKKSHTGARASPRFPPPCFEDCGRRNDEQSLQAIAFAAIAVQVLRIAARS